MVGVEVQLHASLTSAVEGDKWPFLRHSHFNTLDRASGYLLTAGKVFSRANLETLENTNTLHPAEIKPRFPECPVRSLVTIVTELVQHCW